MAAMAGALEQARAGHGQIVAAVGEAGAGKSRLMYEFKATIPHGCKLLEAYSVSHGKASAWLPVLELLRGYFGIQDADDPATRREKVRAALAALDPALSEVLPYLLGLLGIQEGPDPLAQMDPQIRRRRTLEAIKRIILRESPEAPAGGDLRGPSLDRRRDPSIARPARRQRRRCARAAARQLPPRVPP